MKKLTNLKTQPNLQESRLRENLELLDQIRADAVNDIESLTEDFQHMTLVAKSVQRNYRALLAENQLLKGTLLSIIDECGCGQGNRCDRCCKILKILASDNPEEKPDAARKYRAILSQLRNLE
ncbi:hypothetical protein D0A34_19070 [Microcoleus vaginatus PCC 9802]|uniref:hypothetical protein n=1 Tax=Microcoleus vaginatus TaxID=119532 RepID=UPI00020D246F|nr:hypothetical protein MicvaDRAFT_2268 [Microcoleus vaginatus FGP-2]UNU20702.1 hypothetical protein D0A34_19070 [Microcoleus vaginatus PCC 9802]